VTLVLEKPISSTELVVERIEKMRNFTFRISSLGQVEVSFNVFVQIVLSPVLLKISITRRVSRPTLMPSYKKKDFENFVGGEKGGGTRGLKKNVPEQIKKNGNPHLLGWWALFHYAGDGS